MFLAMRKILFFVNIPKPEIKQNILRALLDERLEITEKCHEATFVVQALEQGVRKPILMTQIQVLVGDFSKPQTVPARAICVDQNTGMVQLRDGSMPWREYVREKIQDLGGAS